ncbi:MAG: glycosyltransferase [Egibacteraceae bacterium]
MRLACALLPRYDGVVVLSSVIGEALVETFGLRLNHLVAYPPAPLLALPPVQRRDRPRIVYLGNFYRWQGVDMLLQALRLLDSWDSGCTVRLIGGTREELQSINGDQPLPPQIEDVRRVPPEEVVAELEAADILVVPRPDTPINRTTARKLGEYLASGRHVVVTDVGDHRLLLSSSDCAIVVAPTPEAIAKGLHDAILRVRSEHPAVRDGPDLAARYFGPEATINARLRFFAQSSS